MPAVWPSLLPRFSIVENFTEQPPDTVVRSPMEEGPAKTRQNPNPKPGTIRFQKRLTREQTVILDQFWTETLAKGVLSFQDYHPRTLALKSFRFTARPGFQHLSGPQWLASMELEILPG
ncbi:MAG: hypothetical protein AB7T38_02425 [Nitrospirales bacterium]